MRNEAGPVRHSASSMLPDFGSPIGSRSKFSEAMFADFAADWNENGAGVLERVRMIDPATYLRVATVLAPKELNVAVEQKRILE